MAVRHQHCRQQQGFMTVNNNNFFGIISYDLYAMGYSNSKLRYMAKKYCISNNITTMQKGYFNFEIIDSKVKIVKYDK